MAPWLENLRVDPLPGLLACEDPALVWRVRCDLLDDCGDRTALWALPAAARALGSQQPDGRWRYNGKASRSATAYDLLATYEALLPLVEKFGLRSPHDAIERAAEYMLGYQSEDGDLRGMYGNQWSPNYTAAIVAVMLDAGYPHEDPRIEKAMQWLLWVRQSDGGWAIPFRTLTSAGTNSYNAVMRLPEPLLPDRSKPFSHLITGIVLRAFAAHPGYRTCPDATHAAKLLGSRLFQPDRYPDRRAAEYWEKLRYPFRWTDVLSAVDAMLLVGMGADDPATSSALAWLVEQQESDGLWRSTYTKAADRQIHYWVSFAAARVFRRAYDQ